MWNRVGVSETVDSPSLPHPDDESGSGAAQGLDPQHRGPSVVRWPLATGPGPPVAQGHVSSHHDVSERLSAHSPAPAGGTAEDSTGR